MTKNENKKALNRRGVLRCMAWVGTGVMLTLAGNVLKGMPIAAARGAQHTAGGLRVVRIGDVPPKGDKPTAAVDGRQVVVDNFSFTPTTADVPVGTTVTWTNHDDIPHNVVSPEQKFKSPVLDTDEQFSYQFDAPGTYEYFCSLHPKMTGRIAVG